MKVKVKTIIKRIACITAVFVLSLFAVCESAYTARVYAEDSSVTQSSADSSETEEESKYTNVLEDLQKDESFNVEEYPVGTAVDKMEVIQIAESSDKELFVYVYQPNTDFNYLATEIRMGFPVVNQETEYSDYDLTLLSRDGVFSKYLVEEVTVSEDVIRYYDIVQLARPYESESNSSGSDSSNSSSSNDSSSGGDSSNSSSSNDSSSGDDGWDDGWEDGGFAYSLSKNTGNVINTYVYDVSQKWTVYNLNGSVFYDMTQLETIRIENQYVGYCRYEEPFDGLFGISTYYDSHVVAFSTSYPLEKIVSAKLSYTYQSYEYRQVGFITYKDEFSDPVKREVTIRAEDYITAPSYGWWWEDDLKFPRISTVDEFLEQEKNRAIFRVGNISSKTETAIGQEGREVLRDKQWVFRFAETSYDKNLTTDYYNLKYERISNVTILQLWHARGDYIYSVGVVSNTVSAGDKQPPLNSSTTSVDVDLGAIDDLIKGIGDFFNVIVEIFTLIVYCFIFGLVIWVISKLIGWFISIIRNLFKRR